MSCRPKLCQRLAAQLSHPPPQPFGSNHIWISDELLSDAFNRFFRVSHTSRRYGSNVPGPLEARRRASKRRMGCAVTGASVGPPGGDFGALFGAGVSGESLENGWSWKPPGLQANPPNPTRESSYQWGWSAKPPEPLANWEKTLEVEDHVATSRLAFEKMLRSHESTETLDRTAITVIIDFLTSTEDEPMARNMSKLIQWLAERSLTMEAWQAVSALVCDKIQLASLDDAELLEVIRALPRALHWVPDGDAHQQLHDMLLAFSAKLDMRATPGQGSVQALFEEYRKTMRNEQECSGLVKLLFKTIRHNDSVQVMSRNAVSTFSVILTHVSEEEAQIQLLSQLCDAFASIHPDVKPEFLSHATRLMMSQRIKDYGRQSTALRWLRCLSVDSSFIRDSAQTDAVYAELAKRLRPSQIARHFAAHRTTYLEIVRMLLRTWLPNSDLERLRHAHPQSVVTTSLGTRDLRLLRYRPRQLTQEHLSTISSEFERLHAERTAESWTTLLRAFVRSNVCHEAIVHEIFGICKEGNGPSLLAKNFRHMRERLAMPSSIAVPLIKYFLEWNRPLNALVVFLQEPSVAITNVPQLPLACLEDQKTKVNLFDLLLRQPEILPDEHRALPKLTITQEHIDVVHLIAHDVAHSQKLLMRDSQVYRCVWALYRWLQDRGAPLSPLISRALVHAGITRPISNRTWIPEERLEYVLSIVEEVEGRKTRNSVGELARYMRSSVHEEVLAKRLAKIQGSSNEMAKQVRFRVKKWTKRKPLRTEDERSFWVPKKAAEKGKTSIEAQSGTKPTIAEQPSPLDAFFDPK